MKDLLADIAQKNRRSLNAEIVARLEASLAENREVNDKYEFAAGLRAGELREQRMHEMVRDEPPRDFWPLGQGPGEEKLLRLFRQLPKEKRQALLALLEAV